MQSHYDQGPAQCNAASTTDQPAPKRPLRLTTRGRVAAYSTGAVCLASAWIACHALAEVGAELVHSLTP